ncbi:glycerate kinase [Lentibacillus sp. N15]|uniref:glycerate kinase n=1 Tax=Lentibacillus songyuanensis TaxID=3136161 RepID=UPI0031B9B9D2
MKIVIASDSFKGSASTFEIASFIKKGIIRVVPNAFVIKLPLADGGEGTVDALTTALNGQYIEREVTGPLGKKVKAKFGIIGDIAVIEMAKASGLTILQKEERNPFLTTTYGTGELIKAALDYGVREILIGIGGSSTNDAGVGMAQALGVSFKDKYNEEIGYGAQSIADIKTMDITKIDSRIKNTKITILSDVTNPLCGENGASYVYGPQKGASADDVKKLDSLLYEFGKMIETELQINVMNQKGAGAAGGLGAGLMAFCHAIPSSGIETVLKMLDLEAHIKGADLVITGEGMMDSQSINGKAPIGVANIAKNYRVPVIAIVGSEGAGVNEVYEHGIDLIINIINRPMGMQDAMENVRELTEDAGERAIRAFYLGKRETHKLES